ncbi:MAG TPA: cytochrome c oxidase subunit II [Pirellulales bacterium]|nr:cytochrome c oxidase subunit II [Pirellulales bacterium]
MKDLVLFPPQASTTAHQVDLLFYFLISVCGAVGLLVAFLLIFFAVRYRRRPDQSEAPAETKASHALEWFWTLSPVGAFLVMFVWGADLYLGAFRSPEDATTVYCVGKQWMWKFQHPEGQREINTLHVPVGQPIKVLLTSEDVIHSFFVPAFRVHMDVLPNRYSSAWFEATTPGRYHLFCSQYCGTSHANMIGTVVAMPAADYQAWLEEHAEGSLALEGRKTLLKYRCLSCHSADERARAPVLEGLYGRTVPLRDGRTARVDEAYLRESIMHPAAKVVAGFQAIMPTFEGQISEEEIVSLIAYFKSLQPGETPQRVENYPPPAQTPAIQDEESRE